MSKSKTAVKGTFDTLLIYANYVIKTFNAIFDTEHAPVIRPDKEQNHVSIMLIDLALIYLKPGHGKEVICVVSIHDECNGSVVAELIACLKDIFGKSVYINDEPFVQDEVNNSFIWGRENIDVHNEKVWGRKISHTIMFDDTLAGHS